MYEPLAFRNKLMSDSSATLDVHDKLMSGSYFLGEWVITVFIVKCFDNL